MLRRLQPLERHAIVFEAANKMFHVNKIKNIKKSMPTTIKRDKTRKLTSKSQKSNWRISDEHINNCHADGNGNGAY
jgi:hypothetical protein